MPSPNKPEERILKYIIDNYEYDIETGKLYRFRRTYHDWKETGLSISSNGHHNVKILGVVFQVHNICWFIHYGIWPTLEIDHKDCDPLNNKLLNLREITGSQNSSNRLNRYKTQYRGVEFTLGSYKYSFMVDKVRYAKFGFSTAKEAAIAREEHLNSLGNIYAERNKISDQD